jgi:hypothetical protein
VISNQDNNGRVAFPLIAGAAPDASDLNCLFLRPFGFRKEDLDIDFQQSIRPNLVTEVLHCCTEYKNGNKPDREFLENLSVGKRIEALMAIPRVGQEKGLKILLDCSNESCREMMELEFSAEEIALIANHRSDKPIEVMIEDEILRFRKPNGADQVAWAGKRYKDEKAALKHMMTSLLVDSRQIVNIDRIINNIDCLRAVEDAMESSDPLIHFNIQICCPVCGQSDRYTVNLEDHAVKELKKAQESLLKTVHLLAARYKWSEQQILAIPRWRQQKYLALIDREVT